MNWTIFFFELGYMLNIVGIAVLIWNIRKKKHVEGISFYTQLVFAISTFSKIFFFWFTILRDYFWCWVELIISLTLTIYLMTLMFKYRKMSFMKETNYWDWRIILVVSLVLSIVSNFEKDEDFEFSQMMIRFSIIAEAIGLLPQLNFMKIERYVPQFFGNYIVTLAGSRLARIGFWIFQLKYNTSGSTYYTLILSDSTYLLLTADVIYNFFKHRNATLIPYY